MTVRVAMLGFLLLAGFILAATPSPSWAQGCEGASPLGLLPINKNATGTKLAGPLAIHLELIGENTTLCPGGFETRMSFDMRLAKGNDLFAFAGAKTDGNICFDDFVGQVAVVQQFISDTVIPSLFPALSAPVPICSTSPSPCWDLKSAGEFVQNLTQPPPPFTTILDIELAVKQ